MHIAVGVPLRVDKHNKLICRPPKDLLSYDATKPQLTTFRSQSVP